MLALHLSRRARERYGIESSLFAFSGRAVLADVAAARELAESLVRELGAADPGLAASLTPARLFAMGLTHELLHGAIARYRREVDAGVLREALAWLARRLGEERLTAALHTFAREFPPPAVWRGEATVEGYLAGTTDGRSHREVLLEEMLLLWLANASPAFAPFRELFDDGALRRDTAYPEIAAALEEYLSTRAPFPAGGAGGEARRPSLFEALRAPALVAPESLSGQLAALEELQRGAEAPAVGPARVARGADLLREEERPVFPPGPGPVEVVEIGEADLEGPERFSPDTDWMPSLVLLAKNALVWLSQLSAQHGRPIRLLSEVPDAELEVLAGRGFTGLWLIGIWERSAASRRVKQLCGNPEAEASAYSVASYTVASELGGEEALEDLKRRAGRFGIRLACDMVPNHFGIDSPWVIDHPERFLQLPFSPFPSYRFSGPDLSPDPDVSLFLEDHYYDKTDAAVVFRRIDHTTGEVAYLYHGNDGTSTPWNDTAQLDYLRPAVREAVIATILDVARRFPVIRFDAAMTLARRHVQRLWYPPPGQGGAIPSRAEHGLSPAEFDRAMPEEFWRQVVDRVAVEAPGTLLLAEAFWLMEPYFVRTLGMHRVYNSAFMNLLREERNAEYRKLLKATLAREPEILRRYVNFLNNPDERTAIDQFGGGDKYFGVCTLLATLPGLPMFGHGQVEGLAERYGMEYGRAYRDERPDPWIVARHRRQVTPLLRRRRLFAGSEHFRLYEFEKPGGRVDEDVFAYSNRDGAEVALVVYHNRPAPTRGRLRRSVPLAVRGEDGLPRRPRRENLGEALLAGVPRAGDAAPAGTAPAAGEAPAGPPEGGAPAGAPEEASGPPAAAAERPSPAPAVATQGQEGSPEGNPRLLRCRDVGSGLEHLFDLRVIARQGLMLSLAPYQCHVFLDFAAVADDAQGRWLALCQKLAGRGVPSLEDALLEPELEPVLRPFRALLDPELIHRFAAAAAAVEQSEGGHTELLDEVVARFESFLAALLPRLADGDGGQETPGGEDEALSPAPGAERPPLAQSLRADLEAALTLARWARRIAEAEPAAAAGEPAAPAVVVGPDAGEPAGARDDAGEAEAVARFLTTNLDRGPAAWGTLYALLLLRRLGEVGPPGPESSPTPVASEGAGAPRPDSRRARSLLDELLLGREVEAALRALGAGEEEALDGLLALRVLVAGKLPPLDRAPGASVAPAPGASLASVLSRWLTDPDVRLALRANRFASSTWIHRESLERLLFWGVLATALENGGESPDAAVAHDAGRHIAERAAKAGYALEGLLDLDGLPAPEAGGAASPTASAREHDAGAGPPPAEPDGAGPPPALPAGDERRGADSRARSPRRGARRKRRRR